MTDVLARDVGAWESVCDGVMGGRSEGAMRVDDGQLRFAGNVSLANGGGFASVRSALQTDLTGAWGLALRVRGDGRRYQLRLRHDADTRGISYRIVFGTGATWQGLALPFADFEPVFRGRVVTDAGPLQPGAMRLIGFMTADRAPGPFGLDIGGCTRLDAPAGARPSG